MTSSQEKLLRPSDSGYDAQVLERIKRRVKIDPATGCWLYQGFVHPMKMTAGGYQIGGYGSMGYRGRSNQAVHRVVWSCLHGAPAKGMDVCHTCDVRRCCNPDHLWIGTRSQNLLDMVAKRRGPLGKKAAQTHCIRGHELSGDNLYTTRNGKSRRCVTCLRDYHHTPKHKAWMAEYQRQKRAKKRQEQRT